MEQIVKFEDFEDPITTECDNRECCAEGPQIALFPKPLIGEHPPFGVFAGLKITRAGIDVVVAVQNGMKMTTYSLTWDEISALSEKQYYLEEEYREKQSDQAPAEIPKPFLDMDVID